MGGGGQEDFAKKIFWLCDFREKKFYGPKGRQEKFSGLPKEAFSHSNTCFRTPKSDFALRKQLSQSKICISHSVNCFVHCKNCIIYLGNDFSHYKKGSILLFEKSLLQL